MLRAYFIKYKFINTEQEGSQFEDEETLRESACYEFGGYKFELEYCQIVKIEK